MRGRAVQLALARRAQFRMCLWLVHWLLRPKGRGRDHTYSIYDYVRMHVRATTAPTAPAAAISHVRISKINAQWRSLPTRRLGLQSIYTVHAVPVRTWYKYGIYAQSTQYTATRRIKATIQLLVASYATTLRHGPPCGHLWRERAARVERRGPPHSQPAATSASPSRVSTFPPACAIPTPNFHLRAPLRRRRAHHGQALRWRPDRAQRSGATRARRARLAGARCLVITPRGAPPPAGRCVCPTRRRAPRPRGAARWPPARRCRSPRGRA